MTWWARNRLRGKEREREWRRFVEVMRSRPYDSEWESFVEALNERHNNGAS